MKCLRDSLEKNFKSLGKMESNKSKWQHLEGIFVVFFLAHPTLVWWSLGTLAQFSVSIWMGIKTRSDLIFSTDSQSSALVLARYYSGVFNVRGNLWKISKHSELFEFILPDQPICTKIYWNHKCLGKVVCP